MRSSNVDVAHTCEIPRKVLDSQYEGAIDPGRRFLYACWLRAENPTTATSSKLASSLLFELTRIIVAIPTDVNVKVTMVSISSNSGAISGMAEIAKKRVENTPVLKWLGMPSSETERTLPKDAASAAASGRVRIRRYPSFSIVPFAKASDPRKSATKATNMAETGTSSFREFPSAFASSLTFIGFTVCLA